jgi:glucokinase
MTAIGIDVGGSQVRAGRVDQTGRLLSNIRVATPDQAEGKGFVALLRDLIRRLEATDLSSTAGEWKGVGLALPGIIDLQKKTLVRSVNLPRLERYPLAASLEDSVQKPVILLTDADAATWGEYGAWKDGRGLDPRRGSAHSEDASAPFIHLRVGTGVACGMVADGQSVPLEPARSGHLDVLVVDNSPLATPCRCGKRGCLETVFSGHGLSQKARELGYAEGIEGLMRAARRGESEAEESVTRCIDGLIRSIKRLNERFRPQTISLGGGIIDALHDLVWTRFRSPSLVCDVVPAQLGDEAGMVGAARLLLTRAGSI